MSDFYLAFRMSHHIGMNVNVLLPVTTFLPPKDFSSLLLYQFCSTIVIIVLEERERE